MRSMRRVVVFLLSAACVYSQPRSYTVTPSQGSRVELLVTKTGLLRGKQHLFVFDQYEGTLAYDAQNPEASRVTFTVAAKSAVCKDTWLSAKDLPKVQEFALKDMLDAEHNPNVTFTSTAIRAAGDKFDVQGLLTIRGIAKPAVVSVTLMPRPDGSLGFEGKAEIRLTDYGLKPPSAALGTIGTRNEMALSFVLSGLKPHQGP